MASLDLFVFFLQPLFRTSSNIFKHFKRHLSWHLECEHNVSNIMTDRFTVSTCTNLLSSSHVSGIQDSVLQESEGGTGYNSGQRIAFEEGMEEEKHQ